MDQVETGNLPPQGAAHGPGGRKHAGRVEREIVDVDSLPSYGRRPLGRHRQPPGSVPVDCVNTDGMPPSRCRPRHLETGLGGPAGLWRQGSYDVQDIHRSKVFSPKKRDWERRHGCEPLPTLSPRQHRKGWKANSLFPATDIVEQNKRSNFQITEGVYAFLSHCLSIPASVCRFISCAVC